VVRDALALLRNLQVRLVLIDQLIKRVQMNWISRRYVVSEE